MVKAIWVALALLAIDQGSKIYVTQHMLQERFTIIPGVLSFAPTQNLNGSWLAAIAGITMPWVAQVLIGLVGVSFCLLLYRYTRYILRSQRLPNIWLSLMLGGALAYTCDSVFWGGSWDFLALFDWFIFDIKDVMLAASCIVFIGVIMPLHLRDARNMDEKDRKKLELGYWVRHRCPTNWTDEKPD